MGVLRKTGQSGKSGDQGESGKLAHGSSPGCEKNRVSAVMLALGMVANPAERSPHFTCIVYTVV
jgi:hypothetical protein